MQVWCGFADTREAARACLAPAMEAFYGLPFERFERYCPYGTADAVAGFLASYMAAGCTEFNLIPRAPDLDQAVAGVAAVRAMLAGARGLLGGVCGPDQAGHRPAVRPGGHAPA